MQRVDLTKEDSTEELIADVSMLLEQGMFSHNSDALLKKTLRSFSLHRAIKALTVKNALSLSLWEGMTEYQQQLTRAILEPRIVTMSREERAEYEDNDMAYSMILSLGHLSKSDQKDRKRYQEMNFFLDEINPEEYFHQEDVRDALTRNGKLLKKMLSWAWENKLPCYETLLAIERDEWVLRYVEEAAASRGEEAEALRQHPYIQKIHHMVALKNACADYQGSLINNDEQASQDTIRQLDQLTGILNKANCHVSDRVAAFQKQFDVFRSNVEAKTDSAARSFIKRVFEVLFTLGLYPLYKAIKSKRDRNTFFYWHGDDQRFTDNCHQLTAKLVAAS